MDNVLVEIYVPAAGIDYDVIIPNASKMSEVLLLVKKVINDLTADKYIATAESVLCDKKTGSIYNINMTVKELGIINGSQLMLI